MTTLNTWRGAKKPQGVKAFMGWAGFVVEDASVDILDMLRAYMKKAAGESCGQCFPCRSGLKRISGILDRLCDGIEQPGAENRLRELAHLVATSSRCDLGQTSPQPLLDILAQAPEILTARRTTKASYTSTVTAPCISACPSHVNIPDYLEKIRTRQFTEAFASVMQDCPLPGTIGRVCVRPCELSCKRRLVDVPLAIKHLKRFVADEEVRMHPSILSRTPPVGAKKVAVVGAGPAGLSCAYYLAKNGFAVTIFEMHEEAGGMAKYGIPSYRLPGAVLAREIDRVLALGCEIRFGVKIGRDLAVKDLENQGYEAIFVGAGAPESADMPCDGLNECSEGFVAGVHYLSASARGERLVSGKRAVVIGGGNVAMDCVRTALRQGFSDVQLLYRRTEAEMPADPQEREEAKEEGVVFNVLAAPLQILTAEGHVTGIVCQKMELGEPDASGRRRPVPIKGGTFELACDVVIPAIGQTVAVDVILKGLDGGLTTWNSLEADFLTGKAIGLERIFGGGDCVTGPDTLVAALAAGKRAATYIGAYLRGRAVEATRLERLQYLIAQMGVLDPTERAPFTGYSRPLPIRALPPKERLYGFGEVEFGATEQEAIAEAKRCLRCYRVALAVF